VLGEHAVAGDGYIPMNQRARLRANALIPYARRGSVDGAAAVRTIAAHRFAWSRASLPQPVSSHSHVPVSASALRQHKAEVKSSATLALAVNPEADR
jgi:hypothetical protein